VTLRGAAQLRSRLSAIEHSGRTVAQQWADEGARRTRAQIQRRTGATAASVRSQDVSDTGAQLVGSAVVIYLAKGTKAHEQAPVNAKAMRFEVGGQTIFSKKVHHPATQGNPRILDAARGALTGFADIIRGLWNAAA
jgi:hypothetical protein